MPTRSKNHLQGDCTHGVIRREHTESEHERSAEHRDRGRSSGKRPTFQSVIRTYVTKKSAVAANNEYSEATRVADGSRRYGTCAPEAVRRFSHYT